MKYTIIIAAVLIALSSCKKEDTINLLPSEVDIAMEIKGNSVILNWSMSEDPEMENIKYEVLLDDVSVAQELITTTYTLNNLNYRQSYTLEVKAYTDSQDASSSTTTFDTEYMIATYGGSESDLGAGAILLDDGSRILGVTAYSEDNGFGTNSMTLIKVDRLGNQQWIKTLGGSNHKMLNLLKTTDGNILVIAINRMYKLDLEGNEIWSKGVVESSYRNAINTADGGYLLLGLEFTAAQKRDAAFWKLSSSGAIEWSTTIGGSQHDYIHRAIQHSDGTYTAVGHTWSNDGDIEPNMDFNGEFSEAMAIRLSSTGSKVWVKTLKGPRNDGATTIVEDGGDIFVAGNTTSSGGDYPENDNRQLYIAKMTYNGDLTMIKKIGGSGGDDIVRDLMVSDNHLYLLAELESDNGDITVQYGSQDIWVAKVNLDGDIVEDFTFGGNRTDTAHDIYPLSGAFQFGIVGHSNSTSDDFEGGPGDYQIVFIEY